VFIFNDLDNGCRRAHENGAESSFPRRAVVNAFGV